MEYRFCPLCGSELDLSPKTYGKKNRPRCPRCKFIHYDNPKPCVGAVIVRKGRVLLVKRAYEPYKDHWDFPGGFLESDENPEEGLKRELAEELKVGVKLCRVLGIYLDTYGPGGDATLNIYYLCKILNGKITPNQFEIADAKWFMPYTPSLKLAFGHVDLVLEDLKKWRDKKPVISV
jgi:ADP-ribose pyrophosphatase YjhB (NUDIX family)